MRDSQLDNYRGLMMMYVLFGHASYWMFDLEEPYLSFVLFAMAQVFFISGASLTVSVPRHGLLDTVVGRLWRVVVPFYIYASVILVVFFLAGALMGDTSRFGFMPLRLGDYGWRDVLSIILCSDVPQVPYNSHLWFLAPYLAVSCIFPLEQWLMRRFPSRHLYMVFCIALFLLSQSVVENELLREVLCYNVFMVAGYLYYRRCKMWTRVLAGLAAGTVLAAYVLLLGGHFCPMQGHKFPPDWVFMMYGFFALCLLSVVLGCVKIPANRFLRLWSERSYTIYLYQSVVFVVVENIRQLTYARIPHSLVWVVGDTVLAILLSTLLSFVTYPIEKTVCKWIKKITSNNLYNSRNS